MFTFETATTICGRVRTDTYIRFFTTNLKEQTLNRLKNRAQELKEEKISRANKVSLDSRVLLAGTYPKLTHDSLASTSLAKLQISFIYCLYEFAYKRKSKLDLDLMTTGLLLHTAG